MQELLTFVILGLGPTAIYALAAQGIVLIYRGSGVLNFAHGAMALVCAMVFVETHLERAWPLWLALPLAVATGVALGILVQTLAMRPLRNASQFTRVIATVGVLASLQQAVSIRLGNRTVMPALFLPTGTWQVGSVTVNQDRVLLLVIAVLVSAALWVAYRRTAFGLATTAVAENQRAVSSLGISPSRVALINWGIGGGLAGLAGVLIVPITGVSPAAMTLLVVPAFAAALIGGFHSFGITLAGAVAIGVGQSVLTRYVSSPGWSDALPFLVIIAVLAVRGNAIPSRDEVIARLPKVGRKPVPTLPLLATGAGSAAALLLGPDGWTGMITTTFIASIVGLSVVVLTGFAGQISFAQYTLAGVAALIAGRLSQDLGWPTLLVWIIGVAGAVAASVVFAIPSFRTRGISLAIVTLGLSLAVEKVVFTNPDYIGGYSGTQVDSPSLFGWDISPLNHPDRYGLVALVAAVALVLVVSRLRSGPIGRAALAIRSNERAAAAIGIDVRRVKLSVFALSAAIAAVGGVLLGFRYGTIQYSQFSVLQSLTLVMYLFLTGIGYGLGAVLAACLAPGALLAYATQQFGQVEQWIVLVAGVAVVFSLVLYPDGIANYFARIVERLRGQQQRFSSRNAAPIDADDRRLTRVRPATLEVRGLTVSYGSVRALTGIDLTLEPGTVTGLIGANGAGKTTLLDAISGFVASDGQIRLDDRPVERLSPFERARVGIGRTFQSVELFADLTLRESLLTASDRRVGGRRWWPAIRRRTGDLPPEAAVFVRSLNLEQCLDVSPDELPYGVRRLQGVAQALAVGPSVLLLDEPAAGLDDNETEELGALIRRLADEAGIAILLVEHHVPLVLDVSDRVIAIDFGGVIFDGTAPEASMSDAIRTAYLGAAAEPDPEVVH